METVKVVSFHSYENLVSYSNKIHESVNNIKNEYIYIGALLNEINSFKLYEYDGYQNIAEYCEKEFGFKKSFAYNLMNVQKRFHDEEGSMFSINPKYKDYDFSKLVLMCKMNEEQLHVCNPEYSVKTIFDIKNGLFSSSVKKQNSTRVEDSDCISFKSDSSKFVSSSIEALENKGQNSTRVENKELALTFEIDSLKFIVDVFDKRIQSLSYQIECYELKPFTSEKDKYLDCKNELKKLEDIVLFIDYNLTNVI